MAGGQGRRHDRTDGLEEVTGGTIADVEAVTDDGKPHGVGAVQELTVFDGLNPEVVGNRGRPAAVPAGSVARLRLRAAHSGGSIELTWRDSLGLLRHVAGRQRGTFPEEEILHVLGDQILRLLLPGHEAVLVEDHLHALFPQLPGILRYLVVDPLTELPGPRDVVEARQLLLKLDTRYCSTTLVGRWARRRLGRTTLSHGPIVPPEAGGRS